MDGDVPKKTDGNEDDAFDAGVDTPSGYTDGVPTCQQDEEFQVIPELTNHLTGAFMRRFEC